MTDTSIDLKVIPDVYPTDLDECLKILPKIKYRSFGFPLVFLCYDYTFAGWSIVFRNPVDFNNPDIKAKEPLEACHKMFDFIKTLK